MLSVGTIPSHKDIRCLGFFLKLYRGDAIPQRILYKLQEKKEKSLCTLFESTQYPLGIKKQTLLKSYL